MSFKFSQQAEHQLEDIINEGYAPLKFKTIDEAIHQAKLVIKQAFDSEFEQVALLYGIVIGFKIEAEHANITVTEIAKV